MELVVVGQTIVSRRTWWVHLDRILVFGDSGVVNGPHGRCRRAGTSVHSDNADPQQADKEFEELEDGHNWETNVETENTSEVAEHREQLQAVLNKTPVDYDEADT